MKRAFLFAILLLTCTQSFAQFKGSDFSLNLGYPIPVGSNFVNEGFSVGYKGIADIGLDYTIFKASKVDVGMLINSSFLKFTPADVLLNVISPKVKLGYTMQLRKIVIQPQLALGYVHFGFKGSKYNYKESVDGLAARVSAKAILKSARKINYYLSLAYEMNRIGKLRPEVPSTSYDRNIQFVIPGVGILWNFGRL
ncbi:hypothetical protein [Dyadobacter sandarakinus]|uniref:Outer membrane protein beta-barrel domain-containing protein n=1 Tax=Dyadobacter sandarakinus TaxID=2747268 RepID=A0ABX7I256_9BACT|nr:hypothetical protein [Dyadobacter sandarakinus]QRR00166.1 hypothetical protein HWI92_04225 [Dyadobacter sandarakinus]